MNHRSASSRQRNINIKRGTVTFIFLIIISSVFLLETNSCSTDNHSGTNNPDSTLAVIAEFFTEQHVWAAPDTASIPKDDEGKLILYGRKLIIHTAKYFGPKGSISKTTNGMNCQNCHLDAGTRPYGNNLGSTTSTYPEFLPRAGSVVTIPQKINECFSRSLNGTPIDTNSKEIDIKMGTLSKALASQGGYAAGNEELIDYLRNFSRTFFFSSGLSPPNCASALAALKIIRKDKSLKTKLLENADYLRNSLLGLGFDARGKLQIIPVITKDKTMQFQKILEQRGIFVTGIRQPTVKVPRLRVSVMATHTKEQLDKALAAFKILHARK